jgi:hypothetical protein
VPEASRDQFRCDHWARTIGSSQPSRRHELSVSSGAFRIASASIAEKPWNSVRLPSAPATETC